MSSTVAAILLAAGKSRRMGSCKQLLPLGTSTVLGRCVDTLQSGGVNEIVVVVSDDGHDVAAAAKTYSAHVTVNQESDADMASSIRAGRESLRSGYSGIIIFLCDTPLVDPATIILLAESHTLYPDRIIVPCQQGKRGHPLLFPRTILDELRAGMTLRDLVRRHSTRDYEVAVDDPGIVIDMDTPEDYERVSNIAQVMLIQGKTE
ncbi:MAG TPA: nucleotidyltransferase family protein [Desulfuromonadales bacterium]|nr:nucleotidyltransferase family protein [Desulfuromonadales bacterium]